MIIQILLKYRQHKVYRFVGSGRILQRFPEKDWPDTPFIDGIEWVGLSKYLFLFMLV